MVKPMIKGSSVQALIDRIDTYNDSPGQGTTRVLFTPTESACREMLKQEMADLGMTITQDAMGNIFALCEGTMPELPPVWTGSHIDTVLNGGKYDGMAGVVSAIESVRAMKEQGLEHKRSIVIVIFTSEEPTRFGLSCVGSRGLCGELTEADTKHLFDKDGVVLYDLLAQQGCPMDGFDKMLVSPGQVHCMVELHIEQNKHLEEDGVEIGIVHKICAPTNYGVTVTGVQSHAGGTDMFLRRDPFAAVAEMSMALEQLARECPSEFNTATIGKLSLFPGAENVIPGSVAFTVDVRDCNMDTKDKLVKDWIAAATAIAEKRGVQVAFEQHNHDVPLTCDGAIMDIIAASCDQRGYSHENLISGPYHDSLFVGKFTQAAMIFIPSKDGISHAPEEFTSVEELERGANVLLDTLLAVSNQV